MDIPPLLAGRIQQSGQSACLTFWDRLNPVSQAHLLNQLQGLNWDQLDVLRGLVTQAIATDEELPRDLADASTPACLQLGNPLNTPSPPQAMARGSLALVEGTVGAILVAGGQGTRLGCAGPKGLYAIGPVSQASLFEVLLGKLLGVRRRFGKDVPLAIMTSSATDADTREYLRSHAYCGLDPSHVFVFCQQSLPALDATTGCLLLDAPDHVAMAPDGHGGVLGALSQSGGLDWFAQRGTEQIVSFQVDNPLAMPLD
ncbi:MAG: UTP--glucose-1-phosphate uridylyltransferase, partial [Planctomycetota bacterium]